MQLTIYTDPGSIEETEKPNVARHHDRGFIKSIKHHEGYWTKRRESVIDMKNNDPNIHRGEG